MSVLKPTLFQGARRKRSYFEGWYFKQVSQDGKAWSFIPGVSMSADGAHKRSFIQAIDGSSGTTRWYDFPFEAFRWHPKKFDIYIGGNHFSPEGLDIKLDGPDGALASRLEYAPFTPYPSRPWNPGVMGPYSFVPFMECNHGLVSLDHGVQGYVEANGTRLSMDGGRGYIEKDWGRSMPSAWIWAQSNAFTQEGASLMFSLANIPWLGASFPGFLCAMSLPGPAKTVRIWASWNGSRISRAASNDSDIRITIERKREKLDLGLTRGRGGLLLAPVSGSMDRRIAESVDAIMSVSLTRDGAELFSGRAQPAGLETVGSMESLGLACL
jgi:tocopherol cyclase